MRIAYSPSTRLYAQGPLRCVRRFLRRALLGFAGFAGVLLAFGPYPALGQDTAEAFVAEPDFMRLRAERYANAQDSLDLVDFYHGMGEEDWMDRGWLEASEKMTGAAVAAHEADSLALVDFYHAAGGEGWKDRTGWLEDPVMDWYGVTLNEEGRVVRLQLIDNNLTGTISASLEELGNLNEIWLSYNSLTGPIPSELGNLAKLEALILHYNDLTGMIPASLGRLSLLRGLSLDNNNFTGLIPPELGHLAKLKVLGIGSNELTGPIPASLGRLFQLSRLSLYNNNLHGSIPLELGNLAELKVLVLRDNDLTGSIPASLGHLAKLESLDLADNRITGSIPSELGNLANLERLNFRWNYGLTGSIPRWLKRLTQLERLWLGGNRLTGSIPPELGNLAKLEVLDIAYNDLTGTIPTWLGKLSHLREIYLGGNALTGSIPPSLGSLANLAYLNLSHNLLDPYDFPAWIMNLDKLRMLNLSNTRLRGAIPSELFDLPIYDLSISHNDLEGALPDNVANSKTLSHLYINANYLNALPDLSGLPKLFDVRVLLNRLTFEDFEDRELPAGVRYYEYAPQRRVPTHVARSAFQATFSVEVGGTANKYQWYREGSVEDEAVPGATSDTLVASLSDPPLCYYCKITNAKVPDLMLYSECVSVDDADTQATPNVEASTYTLSLQEGGDPGSYMLALRTDPGGAVAVTPSSSNEESATVSGALAFDPSNWQAPQTVTVTPVADANLEDDTVTITHAVAGYPGVPVGPVVTVTVADATIIISAEEEEQGIPTAFALEQNYPNPFNPSTTIAFTLNKAQRATLSVYDLLGQKVQTLVDGMRPAARYRIPFDASELASGTYLYVLRTEEEIAVKTMLLVK